MKELIVPTIKLGGVVLVGLVFIALAVGLFAAAIGFFFKLFGVI